MKGFFFILIVVLLLWAGYKYVLPKFNKSNDELDEAKK